MTKYRKQTTSNTKNVSRKENKVSEREADSVGPESCRCKDVAKKTPREMLSLMIDDLTFWKKKKGNNPVKSD